MIKRGLWGVAGAGIGGVLGWLVLRSAAWDKVLQGVRGLDWQVLVLALGAVLFAWLVEAYRWKLLLPKEKVSIARLFLVKNAGQGLNNVSPVRALAEIAQTAMLRYGDSVGTNKVVSSLLMGRLFDLLVTVNLVGAGLIVLPQLAGLRPVVFPLWGMTLAALVGFLVLGRKVHATPMTGRLSAVGDVLRSISTVSNSRRVTMGCLCLTATSWMSIGTAAWLVAGAAGIDLPFWLISMVIVAVNLFASVTPALPGAVGVYEFGVISTLGLFAVDPSLALTFALVFHAMLFLPPVLIAIPVLSAERRTMRQVLAVADTAIRSTRQRPRLSLPWVG